MIEDDRLRVFLKFHNNGVINQSTNATFIVLWPKKSQISKISEFKPISLVTSLYKIIAKALLGRIRRVLHVTIFMVEGAFGEVRQILDAILIANDLVDEKKR